MADSAPQGRHVTGRDGVPKTLFGAVEVRHDGGDELVAFAENTRLGDLKDALGSLADDLSVAGVALNGNLALIYISVAP